jgi:hypothetical protein
MADAIAYIQWDNYRQGLDGKGFFAAEPLAFNSRQERLHRVAPGEKLWLVSRCPADGQHYFVGLLRIAAHQRNSADSEVGRAFGEFALVADRRGSHDLAERFPCDGILRALQFETGKPVKFGAHIGQALQTVRFLSIEDLRTLEAPLQRILAGESPVLDAPFGLWTKCDSVFADYFWKNWQARHESLAFLLYDSPPVLAVGAPVFIHSDKNLRLVASFRGSQFITGYKPTANVDERISERERIWSTFRASTIEPPAKSDFDKFWDAQHGVRSLFLMDNLSEFCAKVPFKVYGRALEWGYPMGVGYRYLTLSQSLLLLRTSELSEEAREPYLAPLLSQPVSAAK